MLSLWHSVSILGGVIPFRFSQEKQLSIISDIGRSVNIAEHGMFTRVDFVLPSEDANVAGNGVMTQRLAPLL